MTKDKPVQEVLLECLSAILTPIVRLMLTCGISFREFTGVAQSVYVRVASEDYGIRGRSTNVSRIAALTGLPRKLVSRIRATDAEAPWSPDQKTSPLNTVIHYWRFDPSFSLSPGTPRDLELAGPEGFSELARRYAGDVTAGAIRQELTRVGAIEMTEDEKLRLIKRHSVPETFDEDFIRNLAFSLQNLGETLLHNAELVRIGGASEETHRSRGRFERYAWSSRLSASSIQQFQLWVRDEGNTFLQRADEWIAANESMRQSLQGHRNATGVGVYFFVRE